MNRRDTDKFARLEKRTSQLERLAGGPEAIAAALAKLNAKEREVGEAVERKAKKAEAVARFEAADKVVATAEEALKSAKTRAKKFAEVVEKATKKKPATDADVARAADAVRAIEEMTHALGAAQDNAKLRQAEYDKLA